MEVRRERLTDVGSGADDEEEVEVMAAVVLVVVVEEEEEEEEEEDDAATPVPFSCGTVVILLLFSFEGGVGKMDMAFNVNNACFTSPPTCINVPSANSRNRSG